MRVTIPAVSRTRINWLNDHLPDPADQREYARERCIVALTEALAEVMEEKGISRAELAERLGVSKAHISQVLNGSRNMTLSTLADVLWACGQEARGLRLSDLGVSVVPEGMIPCRRDVISARVETEGVRTPSGLVLQTPPTTSAVGIA